MENPHTGQCNGQKSYFLMNFLKIAYFSQLVTKDTNNLNDQGEDDHTKIHGKHICEIDGIVDMIDRYPSLSYIKNQALYMTFSDGGEDSRFGGDNLTLTWNIILFQFLKGLYLEVIVISIEIS